MNKKLESLNKNALYFVDKYRNLNIYKKVIPAQYFINNIGGELIDLMKSKNIPENYINAVAKGYKNREILFGWYRGKGTTSQIISATKKISRKIKGLSLEQSTQLGIIEFMKLFGLGIDCSGFVYNVLEYAFNKEKLLDAFKNSLAWTDSEKKDVDHAGTFVFEGTASYKIGFEECRPLDIIIIRSRSKYYHIALLLKDKKGLAVAQSALITNPSGVTLTRFNPNGNFPVFSFHPTIGNSWEELYKRKILEFRRLKIVRDLSYHTSKV